MFLYIPKDSKFVLIVVLLLVSAFAIDTILVYSSYVISGIHIIMWVAVEVRLLCAKRRQTTELHPQKMTPHSPGQ